MKINVLEIPEEGLDIDEKEDLEDDTSGLVREIRYRLKIEKFKEDVFIRGGVDAGLGLQCSRCLKDFEDGVSVELDLSFGPARALKGDEKHELRPEEMEAGFYTEDELDLTEITREQVILSIPMKPLCSDSCKGLCPVCGTNLNVGTCKCTKKSIDPRFQSLEKLLKKGKE